jgi:hypothetical protein
MKKSGRAEAMKKLLKLKESKPDLTQAECNL